MPSSGSVATSRGHFPKAAPCAKYAAPRDATVSSPVEKYTASLPITMELHPVDMFTPAITPGWEGAVGVCTNE